MSIFLLRKCVPFVLYFIFMVAIEIIQFMKTKTKGNDGYMMLELYISKVYNRVD